MSVERKIKQIEVYRNMAAGELTKNVNLFLADRDATDIEDIRVYSTQTDSFVAVIVYTENAENAE